MINTEKLIQTFFDLVKIDSISGDEKFVADYIISYLKKINIKASRDRYGNIIAKVEGVGKPLMLSAHMDTVNPGKGIEPVIKNGIIRSKGDTILGADDKIAIAVILETVKYYQNNKKLKNKSLELVFTREEEIGCVGAQKLNYKKIKSKTGLVIDSCRPLGHITIAAPFIYVIDIVVKGKSAHAGSFPEKGVNAIKIASQAIAELKIGRINKTTTSNIGIINGGVAMNTVPDQVIIKAEVRSHKIERAQFYVDAMNKSFKKFTRANKGSLKFKSKLVCSGFSYPKSDKIIKKIAKLNKILGLKTVYEKSGGASDANIFAGKGLKIIDISYGGKGGHTIKESIKVKEIEKLNEFLIEFVLN